jgi:hypothetical protein
VKPRILGALLDAAVRGLQTLHDIRLTSLPRMADFALWATACETALWPAGTFTRAYDVNRKAAVEGIIEVDRIFRPVRASFRDIVAGKIGRGTQKIRCGSRPTAAFRHKFADANCASGGSFAVRQLYTDDDEVLFQAARPLLVNGIEDVISRGDLADRGIFLTLALTATC